MTGVAARRILFVDDARPRTALGAGHPRGLLTLQVLARLGDEVQVIATQGLLGQGLPEEALPPNVSLADGDPDRALVEALSAAPRRVDLVWVGRPNNMLRVHELASRRPALFENTRIVYYAESIFALREIRRHALVGTPLSEVQARRLVRKELVPAETAHAVAATTPAERDVLAAHLRVPIEVLGYPAHVVRDAPGFAPRSGVLFVGAASPADSPNGDSLRLLLESVCPRLDDASLRLDLVGRGTEPDGWLAPLAGPGVSLRGVIGDLAPVFASARVFVAPTRYAAGLPVKVLDATRHGVPVVATSLVAQLLGWRDGVELLVADDAEAFARAIARLHGDESLWARLRDHAWSALERDFAPSVFEARVRALAMGVRALASPG